MLSSIIFPHISGNMNILLLLLEMLIIIESSKNIQITRHHSTRGYYNFDSYQKRSNLGFITDYKYSYETAFIIIGSVSLFFCFFGLFMSDWRSLFRGFLDVQ